jgi:ATP-dependent RNA helicase SUPV3L1/SUV3
MFAPLFALAAAEDITGISRGIAFQLIESIGVLERQKVAEEVKGLDQPSRATLRKYGVRFGAYHIYLPGLLKPAPRSLAAQLWALKHEAPDVKGLDELQRLAASGRTSIPVDKETAKPLYRTIGYRVCGERAIRVDILERLADLIRPALTWRDGAAGAKPSGAFDGSGFTVTGAMTSLTGASGEDFASILRSLGYRMERRPRPAEPANVEKLPEPAAAEQPRETASATPSAEAETPPETVAAEEQTESPALTPDAEPATAIEPAAKASGGESPAVADQSAEKATELAPTAPDQAPTTPDQAEVVLSEVVASAEVAAAEPELIEVWRPGRPSGMRHRREAGKRRRRPNEPHAAQPQGDTAAAADGQAAPASEASPAGSPEGERKERQGRPRHRRDRTREGRAEGDQGRPQHAERRDRQDHKRPDRERPDRPPRGERSDRPPRRDRDRDDNRPGRIWTSANDRRGKEADPNSPFAKLLALKEQLEANKER